MGLSGPRKRTKFSYDPNNTNWSRSESKYGQRILQAQGWKPGDHLGAKDASHAKCHTVASSSHIKVALREENLGIGARVGAAGGEWESTGLDGFQDLLGRLNGKGQAEFEQVQKGREVVKRSHYIERRWGTLRFVSGGLLVGDAIDDANEDGEFQDLHSERMRSDSEVFSQPALGQSVRNLKDSQKKSKKKSKKRRRRGDGNAPVQSGGLQSGETSHVASTAPTVSMDNEAHQRAEKTKRKLLRRQRNEARHQNSLQFLAEEPTPVLASQALPVESVAATHTAAPSKLRSGIQTVRQRNIRQKKMAMMDSKALKEILMIKA